jgi:hypothetical protein
VAIEATITTAVARGIQLVQNASTCHLAVSCMKS